MEKQRTNQQNRAQHKWYALVADALNNQGHTVSDVMRALEQDLEVPWSPHLVKELLIKDLIRQIYGKTSTAELTTEECSQIHEAVGIALAKSLEIDVAFPTSEPPLIGERE